MLSDRTRLRLPFMTAQKIVDALLDVPENPDDPRSFLAHYADAFERLGFSLVTTPTGEPMWAWKSGQAEVQVLRYTAENAADLDVPYALALRGNATRKGYEIWAFRNTVTGKVTHAHQAVSAEQSALALAQRYKEELQ